MLHPSGYNMFGLDRDFFIATECFCVTTKFGQGQELLCHDRVGQGEDKLCRNRVWSKLRTSMSRQSLALDGVFMLRQSNFTLQWSLA